MGGAPFVEGSECRDDCETVGNRSASASSGRRPSSGLMMAFPLRGREEGPARSTCGATVPKWS